MKMREKRNLGKHKPRFSSEPQPISRAPRAYAGSGPLQRCSAGTETRSCNKRPAPPPSSALQRPFKQPGYLLATSPTNVYKILS